jgi:two-component system response regulator CpxR
VKGPDGDPGAVGRWGAAQPGDRAAGRTAGPARRVLVVDDDVDLTEMVREYLELEGFDVDVAHDGAACLSAEAPAWDLIVLDVMLPGMSGFDVLRTLRGGSATPVILLTARDGDTDRIVGLELGADDYVPKPFNPRELVARMRAVLRRVGETGAAPVAEADPGDIAVGEVAVNPATRVATCRGRVLDLTTAEFNLLEFFLRNAGRVVTRDALSAAAFGRHGAQVDRNVDTLVSKVRRKLGPPEDIYRHIKTVRNAGYLYALAAGSPAPGEGDRAGAADSLR